MAIGDILQLEGFDRYPTAGTVGRMNSVWSGETGFAAGRYFGGQAAIFSGGGNNGSQYFRYTDAFHTSFVIGCAIKPDDRGWNSLLAARNGSGIPKALTLGYMDNGRLCLANQLYGAFDYNRALVANGGAEVGVGNKADAIIAGVWQYVELSVEITSPTHGNFRAWVNGELCLELLNVPHGGMTTFDGFGLSRKANAGNASYDDYYLREGPTRLGEIKIETIIPDGTLSNTLPGLIGAASAHAATNENPVNGDVSYVSGSTPGQGVRMTYSDTTTVPNVIRAVHVRSLARKDETQYRSIKNVVQVAGAEVLGKEHTLGVGYKYQFDVFPEKPGGGAWTKADVDALSAGINLHA